MINVLENKMVNICKHVKCVPRESMALLSVSAILRWRRLRLGSQNLSQLIVEVAFGDWICLSNGSSWNTRKKRASFREWIKMVMKRQRMIVEFEYQHSATWMVVETSFEIFWKLQQTLWVGFFLIYIIGFTEFYN